mmetsp:Transcript_7090/g.21406  ORF Transcript_7090/g.21406 Transcript_7090/m.21406 type:complete len:275 (+) Transcript_7090:713-1537(+)
MEYTYASTAFFLSFVSSITLSCNAMSNSSCLHFSSTLSGKPPECVTLIGTSVFFVFFFISILNFGFVSSGSSAAAAASSSFFSPSSSPSPPSSVSIFSLVSPSVFFGSSVFLGSSTIGTCTSSSYSSHTCASVHSTKPFRFNFTFTLTLCLSLPFGTAGKGPISNVPKEDSVAADSSVSVVACTVNCFVFKNVICLVLGIALYFSNNSTSLTSPFASPGHDILIGNANASMTSNSRTLNNGESMAPCNAHPLATDSEAFNVLEIGFWKKSSNAF